MYKQLVFGFITLLFTIALPTCGLAGEVLQRIEQTGIIRGGTRQDSIPFAYLDRQGNWVGYSLDILQLIQKEVEAELGKPIRLELVKVGPNNRFDKIQDQSIDLECGSTTFTWEREKLIDFSLSYFASGTQMLVKKGSSLGEVSSLVGKRIGVVAQTTNKDVISTLQPQAQLVIVKDRFDGLDKLEQGEIDGFASDGILLQALKRIAKKPDQWQIVPDNPYMLESYACILHQDDSQWRDLVNYAIFKFMQGLVTDHPQSVAIYERWFGEEGITPYSREDINDYFLGIIDAFEWLPLNYLNSP